MNPLSPVIFTYQTFEGPVLEANGFVVRSIYFISMRILQKMFKQTNEQNQNVIVCVSVVLMLKEAKPHILF